MLTGILLLYLRFKIMGFSMPVFKPLDNPASFMDSFLLRIINYNYIYWINFWILLCPHWLCFDWSMGCIPVIYGLDRRIIFVILLWLLIGSFIYTIVIEENKRLSR